VLTKRSVGAVRVVVLEVLLQYCGEVARSGDQEKGHRMLHTSGDLLILVNQPTEPAASSDVVDLGCCAVGEGS
jgi:hypothetical protein